MSLSHPPNHPSLRFIPSPPLRSLKINLRWAVEDFFKVDARFTATYIFVTMCLNDSLKKRWDRVAECVSKAFSSTRVTTSLVFFYFIHPLCQPYLTHVSGLSLGTTEETPSNHWIPRLHLVVSVSSHWLISQILCIFRSRTIVLSALLSVAWTNLFLWLCKINFKTLRDFWQEKLS